MKSDPNLRIGIFWVYQEEIFSYSESISSSNQHGDVNDVGMAHYHLWELIREQHQKLHYLEYEEVNRGRVLYLNERKVHRVVSNSEVLTDEKVIEQLREIYGIEASSIELIHDEHYKLLH